MMAFVEYNNNPRGLKTDDCVIRAISKATGESWLNTFDRLISHARVVCTCQTGKEAYTDLLHDYPSFSVFKYVDGEKKRLTVKDVCKLKGSYVVRVANHMVAVVDGKYYDIFDSGDKCAYKIWRTKKGDEE